MAQELERRQQVTSDAQGIRQILEAEGMLAQQIPEEWLVLWVPIRTCHSTCPACT